MDLEAFPGYTYFKETSRLASEQYKASTAAHTDFILYFFIEAQNVRNFPYPRQGLIESILTYFVGEYLTRSCSSSLLVHSSVKSCL